MNDGIPKLPLIVSLVQNSAGNNIADNLKNIERLLLDSPRSDLIAMPEVFAIRGDHENYRSAAETIVHKKQGGKDETALNTGPIMKWLYALAARLGSWIIAGSVIEKYNNDLFNTSVLIDREGSLAATYRKIHLFEARLNNGTTIKENDVYQAGNEPVITTIEGWRCGMAICFDLRFPELFRHYASKSAHLFFVPSNFLYKTGRDHWETLLRARAIENQSFAVAPNQCGRDPFTGAESYGHSLIVGPWGEVISKAEHEECVITATLDPTKIERARERIIMSNPKYTG